jgi:hypothetical protein
MSSEMRTSGVLLKKCKNVEDSSESQPFQTFRPFFFIVDNYSFRYYDKEPDPESSLEITARGTIDLSSCSLVTNHHNTRIENYFELVTHGKTTKLAARSIMEYEQWIETLTYVINLAKDKRNPVTELSVLPHLKVKVNGLIPLQGDLESHAILVVISGIDFSFISPVFSSHPNNNSILFHIPSESYRSGGGPVQIRVVQVSSASSSLPQLIRSKIGGQTSLDISFCSRGRIVAENDIDVELCKSVAEGGKTVVVSIVSNIAAAHPPPPPVLSPDGAAVVNKTRILLGNVRSDLKMSEEQVQEVRKSTAERKEELENVEKKWFSQKVPSPVVNVHPPALVTPYSHHLLTPTTATAPFLSPPRAVLARAATISDRDEVIDMMMSRDKEKDYPLSSKYDDNFDKAMNLVSEIIARRSATSHVVIPGHSTFSHPYVKSHTPQRQAENNSPKTRPTINHSQAITTSSSSFLQAPAPSLPQSSTALKATSPSSALPRALSPSASGEKKHLSQSSRFFPTPSPITSSIIEPTDSLTDDEKIRRLISTSLRQDVKKAPVRLKIDSSRSLIKRLFSRFGEGGTTRQVPLYRFQDLCLRACHRSVSQDQINAAFKYAKSLDQKDDVSSSSLEESLDFTAFVNALFIVSFLPFSNQIYDPLVKFSTFVDEKLTALAKRLKIIHRKAGNASNSSNSSFITDDALSFTQENISAVSETSPPRHSKQEIEISSSDQQEMLSSDHQGKETFTDLDATTELAAENTTSLMLTPAATASSDATFSAHSPLKDLSPLPQALFNLLKESPPSYSSSRKGERSVAARVDEMKSPSPKLAPLSTKQIETASSIMKVEEGDGVDDDIKRLSARIQALDMDFTFSGKSAKKLPDTASMNTQSEGPLDLQDLLQKEEYQQYNFKKKTTMTLASPSQIFSPSTNSSSSSSTVKGNGGGTLSFSSTLRTLDLPEVRAIFAADQNAIAVVFNHYADLRVNRLPPPSGKKKKSNAGSSLSFLSDRSLLLLNDVLRFAHDFEIIPTMMSSAQFAIVFSSIAVSSAKGSDPGRTNQGVAQTLRLSDFSELLAKVAIKSFHESGPRFPPRQAAVHFLRSLDESKGRSIMSSQDSAVTFRFGRKGR